MTRLTSRSFLRQRGLAGRDLTWIRLPSFPRILRGTPKVPTARHLNALINRAQRAIESHPLDIVLNRFVRDTFACEDHGMNQSATQTAAERQIAEAMAAERESLRPECRADAARFERLLAPDFHEFGTSGGEIGYEGTAARVAEETDPNGEPILVENMRGWLLAEGLVMLKYVSENSGRRSNRTSLWRRVEPGHWQVFHHQGTLAAP